MNRKVLHGSLPWHANHSPVGAPGVDPPSVTNLLASHREHNQCPGTAQPCSKSSCGSSKRLHFQLALRQQVTLPPLLVVVVFFQHSCSKERRMSDQQRRSRCKLSCTHCRVSSHVPDSSPLRPSLHPECFSAPCCAGGQGVLQRREAVSALPREGPPLR